MKQQLKPILSDKTQAHLKKQMDDFILKNPSLTKPYEKTGFRLRRDLLNKNADETAPSTTRNSD